MLKAATSLAEVYKTASPKPLVTREELDAFYSSRLNAVRGEDHVDRLTSDVEIRSCEETAVEAFFRQESCQRRTSRRLPADIRANTRC